MPFPFSLLFLLSYFSCSCSVALYPYLAPLTVSRYEPFPLPPFTHLPLLFLFLPLCCLLLSSFICPSLPFPLLPHHSFNPSLSWSSWQPIMKFINDQYEAYLQEEININRKKRIPDSRVHCCIYFIPPTGHWYGHIQTRLNIDMWAHTSALKTYTESWGSLNINSCFFVRAQHSNTKMISVALIRERTRDVGRYGKDEATTRSRLT